MTVSMDFAELVSFARDAGQATASGSDGLFEVACQVMYYGAANPSATASTYQAIYKAYAEAQNASAFGRKIDLANEKSVVVSSSRLASFAKVGALGHFTLPNIVASRVDLLEGKSGSMYSLMCKVNAAQVKAGKKILTEKEVDALLSPAPAKDKSVDEFLEAEFKRFTKFGDEKLTGVDATRFAALQQMLTVVATEWLASPDDISVVVSHDDADEAPAPEAPADELAPAELTTATVADMLGALGRVSAH